MTTLSLFFINSDLVVLLYYAPFLASD